MPRATTRSVEAAQLMEAERAKLLAPSVMASRRLGLRVRAAAVAAWRRGRDPLLAVRAILGEHFTPLIRDAMLASWMAGWVRTWRAAGTRVPSVMRLAAYDDAVRFWTERAQLTPEQEAELISAYGDNAVNVTRQMTRTVEERLRVTVAELTGKQAHVREGIKGIRAAFESAGVTAETHPLLRKQPHLFETLFRTQTQMAYAAGREAAAGDSVIQDILWGWEYVTVGDDRVRPNHVGLHGTRLPKEDAGWDRITPPNGFNSFVPDTRIMARALAGSKAWYAGPVIEIETVSGIRLTVTPNHPILTPAGWVPAGRLCKGQDLFQYAPAVKGFVAAARDDALAPPFPPARGVNNQEVPPRIEDAYEAIAAEGIRTTLAAGLPLDFHGDGRFYQGQIHVVRPYGVLPRHQPRHPLEVVDQPHFMLGADPARSVQHGPGLAHLGGGVLCCFSSPPTLDARTIQAATDDRSRTAVLLRQLQFRHPGLVQLDQVARLHIRTWVGHVYDLQTPDGTIVANGLVVSNCRCTKVEIWVDDEEELRTPNPPRAVEDDQGDLVMPGADKGWDFHPGSSTPHLVARFPRVEKPTLPKLLPPPKPTPPKPKPVPPKPPKPKPKPVPARPDYRGLAVDEAVEKWRPEAEKIKQRMEEAVADVAKRQEPLRERQRALRARQVQALKERTDASLAKANAIAKYAGLEEAKTPWKVQSLDDLIAQPYFKGLGVDGVTAIGQQVRRIEALEVELASLRAEMQSVGGKLDDLDKERIARMRDVLRQGSSPNMGTKYASKVFTGQRKRDVEDGVAWVQSAWAEPSDIRGTTVTVKANRRRRSDAWGSAINLAKVADTRTVVHEMGHWMEFQSQHVFDRAQQYLEHRTAGVPQTWLGDRYHRSEKARRGVFREDYVGKIYEDKAGNRYASEVTSVGMEQLYRAPIKFATEEPDYFAFITGLMAGAI